MKRTKSVKQKLRFGPESRLVWITASELNRVATIELADDEGRSEQSVEIEIPLCVAEKLAKQLTETLEKLEQKAEEQRQILQDKVYVAEDDGTAEQLHS